MNDRDELFLHLGIVMGHVMRPDQFDRLRESLATDERTRAYVQFLIDKLSAAMPAKDASS